MVYVVQNVTQMDEHCLKSVREFIYNTILKTANNRSATFQIHHSLMKSIVKELDNNEFTTLVSPSTLSDKMVTLQVMWDELYTTNIKV